MKGKVGETGAGLSIGVREIKIDYSTTHSELGFVLFSFLCVLCDLYP